MSKVKQEILAMLPVAVVKAKDTKGVWHDVLVDGDYDGEYFSHFQWRVLPIGYVATWRHEKKPDGTRQTIVTYLHHMVLPKRPGLWTHFINGNKLDCRSANLEYQTPRENALSRKQPTSYTPRKRVKRGASQAYSKYRGVGRVCTSSQGRLWVSSTRWHAICCGKYLGTFGSEEEAARAYDKRAYEIWGDKAILNFPEEHGNDR